jgi:hypothetical protein
MSQRLRALGILGIGALVALFAVLPLAGALLMLHVRRRSA